jgi:hypothetical protein
MLMQVEYPENLPDVLSESRQEFEFEAQREAGGLYEDIVDIRTQITRR